MKAFKDMNFSEWYRDSYVTHFIELTDQQKGEIFRKYCLLKKQLKSNYESERVKNYKRLNKDKIKQNTKVYYEKNKPMILERNRRYYQKHKERILEMRKKKEKGSIDKRKLRTFYKFEDWYKKYYTIPFDSWNRDMQEKIKKKFLHVEKVRLNDMNYRVR